MSTCFILEIRKLGSDLSALSAATHICLRTSSPEFLLSLMQETWPCSGTPRAALHFDLDTYAFWLECAWSGRKSTHRAVAELPGPWPAGWVNRHMEDVLDYIGFPKMLMGFSTLCFILRIWVFILKCLPITNCHILKDVMYLRFIQIQRKTFLRVMQVGIEEKDEHKGHSEGIISRTCAVIWWEQ